MYEKMVNKMFIDT